VVIAVFLLAYNHGWRPKPEPLIDYLIALPLLQALYCAGKHLQRGFTRLTVEGGKLRYESGILSRSTRTMEIGKVQDVRVDQSVGQRIFGIGNLTLETAGETSRLTIAGIDQPQQAADHILELAHQAGERR